MDWWKQCSLASLPDPPHRGPGGRVGRGVIRLKILLDYLSPRGLVRVFFVRSSCVKLNVELFILRLLVISVDVVAFVLSVPMGAGGRMHK